MEGYKLGDKYVVGRKEKVAFPDLRRRNIVARIDTGAYSTAAHCDRIWTEKFGKEKVLCCRFLKRSKRVTRFHKFRQRKVRSSNGEVQLRYVVRLKMKLGPVELESDVTLTDRSTMNYSVLIGRRFLAKEFIVDVSRTYIQSRKKKK